MEDTAPPPPGDDIEMARGAGVDAADIELRRYSDDNLAATAEDRSVAAAIDQYNLNVAYDPNEEDPANLEKQFRLRVEPFVPVLIIRRRLNDAGGGGGGGEETRAALGHLIASPGFDALDLVFQKLVDPPFAGYSAGGAAVTRRSSRVMTVGAAPPGVDTVALHGTVNRHVNSSRAQSNAARSQGGGCPEELAILFDALNAHYYVSKNARARQLAKCERVCKTWHARLVGESRSIYRDLTGLDREEFQQIKLYRGQVKQLRAAQTGAARSFEKALKDTDGRMLVPFGCLAFAMFAFVFLVPTSLLLFAANMDRKDTAGSPDTGDAATPASVEPFQQFAFGFYTVGIAGACALLCALPVAVDTIYQGCRFRSARHSAENAETTLDPDLRAIALQRTESDDTENSNTTTTEMTPVAVAGVGLRAPQLPTAGAATAPEAAHIGLSTSRQASSSYSAFNYVCGCGLFFTATGVCGGMVAYKLDGQLTPGEGASTTGSSGSGSDSEVTWIWAMSPLWLFLPVVLIITACAQYLVFASRCCTRTNPCGDNLQAVYSHLYSVACLGGCGVWFALPFLSQMDHPTDEEPTAGSSFSVALGLLLFAMAGCACIFNPGLFPTMLCIDDGSSSEDTVWPLRSLLTCCVWLTFGGTFIASFCIGMYLISMRLTGHTPSFLANAGYLEATSMFVFGIPCALCICGPCAVYFYSECTGGSISRYLD